MRRLTRRGALTLGLGGSLAMVWASTGVAGAPGLRVVTAGGAITETFYALGASDALVGVDTTSSHPAAVRKLPNVGYMRTLSAEGVLALSPTHLVVTEDAGPPLVMRQLAEAGVKVVVLNADHRFEGVLDRISRIGQLTQRRAQAEAMAEGLKREWAVASEQVRAAQARRQQAWGGRPMRVLFVMAHSLSQVMVAGRDTAADAMLAYIGAHNPMAVQFSGYKALTAEAAIAAAPDVIVATEQGVQTAGGLSGLLRLPGLAETPAGRLGRVVSMDALWMLGFGPRLPSAVRTLSQACDQAVIAGGLRPQEQT
jgi:iron complex transport system substrate-binding protein